MMMSVKPQSESKGSGANFKKGRCVERVAPGEMVSLAFRKSKFAPEPTLIDVNRIGVFGFSAGGVPDLAKLVPYCQAHPETVTCAMLRASPDIMERLVRLSSSVWEHDPRIRAAVVAAPAVGFAFGKPSLKDVRIPVQLWRAEFEHILPFPDYAEAVRLALPHTGLQIG
jgi:predicted dienelactone hydrolase